jgi:hypothetical protein
MACRAVAREASEGWWAREIAYKACRLSTYRPGAGKNDPLCCKRNFRQSPHHAMAAKIANCTPPNLGRPFLPPFVFTLLLYLPLKLSSSQALKLSSSSNVLKRFKIENRFAHSRSATGPTARQRPRPGAEIGGGEVSRMMLHELEHPCPPTIISKSSLNVCFWHKADILVVFSDVRFWG